MRILTNSMEPHPSSEANNRSTTQEIPKVTEPQGFLLCSQEPATGPYSEWKV
jgi:hypothetical protein